MDKERDYIDAYFSELGDQKVTPPEDVWVRIEDTLRKRRIYLLKFWTGMAAGLIMMFSVGGYLFYNGHRHSVNQPLVSYTHPYNEKTKEQSVRQEKKKEYVFHAPVNKTGSGKTVKHGYSAVTKNEFSTSNTEQFNSEQNQITGQGQSKETVTVTGGISNEESQDPSKDKSVVSGNYLPSLPAFAEPLRVNKPLIVQTENKPQENLFASEQLSQPADLPKMERKSAWSVSGQFAPLYSYHRESSSGDQFYSTGLARVNEKALVAYAGGFKVNYQSSSRISFQAGVYVSVMGQQMEDIVATTRITASAYSNAGYSNSGTGNAVVSNNDIKNSFGFISNSSNTVYSPTSPNRYAQSSNLDFQSNSKNNFTPYVYSQYGKIRQEMKYIEVPFLVRYMILDKKIGFHVLGGMTTHFLIGDQSYFLPDDGTKRSIGETKDLSPVNYSSTFGIGLDYKISKRVNFTMEPTYKYYLNSVSGNTNIHPYSFGVFTGVSLAF